MRFGRTLSGGAAELRRTAPAVVLEGGIGADQNQLVALEEDLAQRTVVCAYDRAGLPARATLRRSPPPPLADVDADIDGFIAAAGLEPPEFLVGHSAEA